MLRHRRLELSAVLISLCVALDAAAQSGPSSSDAGALSEIVVTATKSGATDLQKTPLAVSAFTADQLEQMGALNIKDIAPFTPNLQVSQVTANAVIAIRGIGSNNVFAGSDPDVTMQIDGVYIARPSGQFADFLDVERVEVLRGPQGTLYGRNAVGGTINIVSRQPTDNFAAEELFTTGNYGLVQEQAYVSGPLITGKLQGSMSVDYIRHNDYEKNIADAGPKGINNADRGGARVQLRYEPSEAVDMTTRADWAEIDEDPEAYDHLFVPYPADKLGATIIGNYSKVALNSPQTNVQLAKGISEEINVNLDEHYMLKSISAYRTNSYNFNYDSDATPLDVNYSLNADDEREATQEFNLSANYSRFKGVAGLYYFYESEQGINQTTVPGRLARVTTSPLVYTRSEAAFAQGSYTIIPELQLIVGGRYTRDAKSLEANYQYQFLSPSLAPVSNRPGFPIDFSTDQTFDAFTPKFGLEWQVAANAMVYISATRGFKSGGENYAATNIKTANYAPEYIWSYELGAKTEWLDRRLRLNLTGFYYDYKDLQVQSNIALGVTAISNAASAVDKGLEAELVAQITRGFRLNVALSLLDARYLSFTNASVPVALKPFLAGDPRYDAALATYDASGNYLNNAPKLSGSIGGQYDWLLSSDARFYAEGDVSYRGRDYFDASNSEYQSQGGYELLNASAGYISRFSGWQFELWGKNLANRQYLLGTVASVLEPAGVAAPPRTFGVRIGKKW